MKENAFDFFFDSLATSHTDYSSVWSFLLHSSSLQSQNITRSFRSCSLANQLTDTNNTSGYTKQRTTRGLLAIYSSRFNVSLMLLIHLGAFCRYHRDKWTDFNLLSSFQAHQPEWRIHSKNLSIHNGNIFYRTHIPITSSHRDDQNEM